MSDSRRIGVAIVTYMSDDVLPALLASLARHEPQASVVVVDSASPSGPPATGEIPVIALRDNKGYGAAVNVGIRWLLARNAELEVLAFLNPDVRLNGASLSQLARELDEHDETGIATGPLLDSTGRRIPSAWGPQSVLRCFWFATGWNAHRLRRALGRFSLRGVMTSGVSLASESMVVDGFVRGGTMIVRTACWRDVGGFDEDFFMFGEDVDFCTRARRAGWEVRMLPCDPITLDDRGSSASADHEKRFAWYAEGTRRYALKHLSPRQARACDRALRLGRAIAMRRRKSQERMH